MTGASPIDVDDPDTWPATTEAWATTRADSVRGSTEHTADLALDLDDEPTFRATFGDRPLLAYHCTRLRAREVDDVRGHGLRLLTSELVRDRIDAAHADAELPDEAYRFATTRNVYAIDNTTGREGQICFVLGRTTFDDDARGCEPLLTCWGGEAMRGGPDDAAALRLASDPEPVALAGVLHALRTVGFRRTAEAWRVVFDEEGVAPTNTFVATSVALGAGDANLLPDNRSGSSSACGR